MPAPNRQRQIGDRNMNAGFSGHSPRARHNRPVVSATVHSMQRLWNFVLVTAFAAAPHAGIAGASLSGTLSREDIALIGRATWGVNTTTAGQ
jgi:hypothetical protein